jgi:hypothetical protein
LVVSKLASLQNRGLRRKSSESRLVFFTGTIPVSGIVFLNLLKPSLGDTLLAIEERGDGSIGGQELLGYDAFLVLVVFEVLLEDEFCVRFDFLQKSFEPIFLCIFIFTPLFRHF